MASINTFDRVDRLNSDNYRTWKFVMKMLLIQRELWDYVNGTVTLQADATAEQKVRHKSKDEKALSTIALSIEADQQVHIVNCETARQTWLVLEEIYEPKSRQRIMQLKRQFVRIRLKDDENMESYVSRLKICSDYLREAGAEVKDEDLAYAMLSGLPETYDALTMILASLEDEKFTSAEIRKSLTMEYDRRMSNARTNSRSKRLQHIKRKKVNKVYLVNLLSRENVSVAVSKDILLSIAEAKRKRTARARLPKTNKSPCLRMLITLCWMTPG